MNMKAQNGMRKQEESSPKLVSESTVRAEAEQMNDYLQPTKKPSSETNIIAIGASAGGVEALEELFTVMPQRLGMSFVVVQHLSPDFKSLMPQILARKTGIPVVAIDRDLPLEANKVYVLPSGKGLRVSNRVLTPVDQPPTNQISKPIDDFFCSLAEDVGESAIGIVLSGTGNDGSRGVKAIHEAGGLVIAQSENSAKFNGMPRSAINTGIVDLIATLDEIPNSLIRFSGLTAGDDKGTKVLQFAQSMDAEKRIHHLLHKQFGIDFEQYKTDMFGRRVERRMCLTKEESLENYLRRLEVNSQELTQLYSDLLIGVTEFFRDPAAFKELSLRVLPTLLDAAAPSGEFRVWIAPCASGEEAYSVAILIDELLSHRDFSLDVKIFATDVNKSGVDVASNGIYPEACLDNVSAERLEKYFNKVDDGYQVCRELRKQIVFAQHDVLQDAPFTKLDLVCCRNLLIYLKDEAKRKILALFNFSLNDAGVLFLGPSESLGGFVNEFRVVNEKWRFFRKTAPVRLSSVNMPSTPPLRSRATKARAERHGLPQSEMLNVYDSLLGEHMPPGLLVGQNNQIVHIFGAATQFLEFKQGRPASNCFDLLPPTFRIAVANGMKRVRHDDKPVVYPGLQLEVEGETKEFRITIKPAVSGTSTQSFLVLFQDCEVSKLVPTDVTLLDNGSASLERIQFLEEQLQSTRESLHDSILDLKSANEEMQSTNEELIASNEELQSTNEELHSVNEELYTVNSEHQRKITELTEMTDDMENLLDGIQVDTVFLDRELKVRKFTLGIAKTFRLIPQDIGRHIDSFNHELKHNDIVGQVESVLKNERGIEEEVQDKHGKWFLMRLLPYSSKGKVDGVLLTLIEITKIKDTERKLAELSEIVEASDDAIFRIDLDGEIRTWNRGAENLFLYDAKTMVGQNIKELALDRDSSSVVSDSLGKIVSGEKIDHIELKALRRNSEEIDVHLTVSPIYNSDGTLDGASIVLRDITSQKLSEELNRQEVRRRDQFLAMLSHELRNPIAAIVSSLAVLKKSASNEALNVIRRHSKHLSLLLNDLLDVSRITHDKIKLDRKPLDLVALASEIIECVEPRIQSKDQFLTVDAPVKPIFVKVDKTRIVQAQVNLLVNASKYTQDGGNIVYTIRAEQNHAVITISDDGEGMSTDLLKRVFEVFVQADQPLDRGQGGMGLGLPLVRMITNAHGGEITGNSGGLGKGSEFVLRLPLTKEQPKPTKQLGQDDAYDFSESDLLLIEDNEGARKMMATFLECEGFTVRTASNGVEGVSSFEATPSSVCVVDIGLPDRNGYEVARDIRSHSKQPDLLIALTGYGQEKDVALAIDAGFDLHLTKPIDPEELVAIIGKNLNASSS
jgi:two-component system CheB/CheR fusion protein